MRIPPQRDVAVHGERDGVHELGCVRHKCEEGHTQELLINPGAFQDDVNDVDEQLYEARQHPPIDRHSLVQTRLR